MSCFSSTGYLISSNYRNFQTSAARSIYYLQFNQNPLQIYDDRHLIQCIDDEIELVPMNLKLSIDLIVRCWKIVSLTCIRNCFRKAGFAENILEPEEAIQVAEQAVTILKERVIVANEFSFEDDVNFERNLVISSPVDDESIVKRTIEKLTQDQQNTIESNDEKGAGKIPKRKISRYESYDMH